MGMLSGGAEDGARRDPQAAFVVFEGVEGSGKSTQMARLAARVESLGRRPLLTREPGGTPLGDALRELLLDPRAGALDGLTELFLLSAARRSHVSQIIRPALASGGVVFCDRFADSSVAYQGGGRGLGFELVERVNELSTGGLRPDRTLLLDLPAEEGMKRVSGRSRLEDRLEREELEFHRRVRAAYLDLARRRASEYAVIDAALPVADVEARVWALVGPLIVGAE